MITNDLPAVPMLGGGAVLGDLAKKIKLIAGCGLWRAGTGVKSVKTGRRRDGSVVKLLPAESEGLNSELRGSHMLNFPPSAPMVR